MKLHKPGLLLPWMTTQQTHRWVRTTRCKTRLLVAWWRWALVLAVAERKRKPLERNPDACVLCGYVNPIQPVRPPSRCPSQPRLSSNPTSEDVNE
jgi:hypothetical protein